MTTAENSFRITLFSGRYGEQLIAVLEGFKAFHGHVEPGTALVTVQSEFDIDVFLTELTDVEEIRRRLKHWYSVTSEFPIGEITVWRQ